MRQEVVKVVTPSFLEVIDIDVNCQDHQGNTLLMNALILFSTRSLEFSVHLILEKSADVHIKDYTGNNVFHQLAMLDYKNEVESLKLTDYCEYQKQKKLRYELYKKFFQIYTTNGIDINQKNLAGDTPLSIALREQNMLFLDLITSMDSLCVDHVVHEKSELHFLKFIIFTIKAPEILQRLISRSKDFALLMQLYNTENGYNGFHSILNEIVTKYYEQLESKKAQIS